MSNQTLEMKQESELQSAKELFTQELSSLQTEIQAPRKVEKKWTGPKLTKNAWTVQWPSGKETFYNLDMSVVVDDLRAKWFNEKYWVRNDGVKMYGEYVMVAANGYPKWTIIPTTLGPWIVCDRGWMVWKHIDIAVTWKVWGKKKKANRR